MIADKINCDLSQSFVHMLLCCVRVQAVIRANPRDVYAFSAEYFRNKAAIPGNPVPGSDVTARE